MDYDKAKLCLAMHDFELIAYKIMTAKDSLVTFILSSHDLKAFSLSFFYQFYTCLFKFIS